MNSNFMVKLYSVSEYAKKLRISRQAVLKMIKVGRLKSIRVGSEYIILK